jgi:hypothetical protein
MVDRLVRQQGNGFGYMDWYGTSTILWIFEVATTGIPLYMDVIYV